MTCLKVRFAVNCPNTVSGDIAGPYSDLVGFFSWTSWSLLNAVSLIAETLAPVSILKVTSTLFTLSTVTHCVCCCDSTVPRNLSSFSASEVFVCSVDSTVETAIVAFLDRQKLL